MVKEMKEHFLYYFNLALQGKISIKEIEIPVSKNQSVWFLISFYPVYNQDNQLIGVSYNATNIHEIKEIATLLQKKNEMLMEIARIQSHEVRKPVAHILGLISIFNRENLNSENLKLLEYLKKSTQDLDAVIHRIVSETNPII
jgi:signal transduction histidine kinase